ncbi:hypothetical protein RJT34_21856 [Clitoria ternatea]|uniref:Uncharacterized protein n=1 Tax=Clitoria ternatea TaxID=43366 RepID=A0AAN9IV08_CLITE
MNSSRQAYETLSSGIVGSLEPLRLSTFFISKNILGSFEGVQVSDSLGFCSKPGVGDYRESRSCLSLSWT